MNPSTIEFIRQTVHIASIFLLAIGVIIVAVGFIKPAILRRLFREFAERKYVIVAGLFACLLSATIFTATQAPNRPPASQIIKPVQEQVKKLPTSPGPSNPEVSTNETESSGRQVALRGASTSTPSHTQPAASAETQEVKSSEQAAIHAAPHSQAAEPPKDNCKDKSTVSQLICRPLELIR